MIYLRSVLYFTTMVITAVLFGGFIYLTGRFLPTSSLDETATRWGRANLWLMRVICNLDLEIHGKENLPEKGPAIVMSKHQSTWETIALRGLLHAHQSWILKQELLRIPIFGWALKFCKAIAIDRSAGRKAILKVVKDGTQRLEESRIVVVFPEGTRTAPGERRKYGLGGAILAQKTAATVIPIAHNAGVFWKRRGVKKYPGTINMIVGEAISTEGRKAADIMAEVEDWIEARQKEMPLELASH